MRVPFASVLKALCGVAFAMRADAFWGIGTVNRPQLVHPVRSHPYGLLRLDAKKKSCAVLVDAENTPYESLRFVLDQLNEMGYDPQMKKAYGEWSKTNLKPYKNIEQNLSFTKIHSLGKGTSDAAMIVGAMDILHKHPKIGCFALVTSDSDFTPLVAHLEQAGKVTIGFGKKQSSKALVKEHNEFVFLDDQTSQKKAAKLMNKGQLIQFLSKRILQESDGWGWAPLSALGKDFDHRLYGYKKMIKYFDDKGDRFQLDSTRDFVRILLPKDSLNHIGDLIVSCHNEDHWAPVKTLEENFNACSYGYDDMKHLLDDFPQLFIQATDDNMSLVVRNKVPEMHIQKLKKMVLESMKEDGYARLADIEANIHVDSWRRFGYQKLRDLLRHESDHFLIESTLHGSYYLKIRA